MNLYQLLQEQNLSRYRLSKNSGVPWATLADICSGKTRLDRCSAGTLAKLSDALGLTVESLLQIEMIPTAGSNGKPQKQDDLETGLPEDLTKSIQDYIQGEQEHSSVLDCLWGELYGSINANFWGGRITEEQAKFLRAKYLYDEEKEANGND